MRNKSKLFLGSAGLASLGFTLAAWPRRATADGGVPTSLNALWKEVASDPYPELPHDEVSLGRFFSWGVNLLERDARRTIDEASDLRPRFDKLLHPNGICLKGTWEIAGPSPYTGLLAEGARGQVIARASVALTETERGHDRAFGFAAKVFPTTAGDEAVTTANFFAIDDLAGTDAAHYLDVAMTNEPALGFRPSTIFLAPIAAAAGAALAAADKSPGMRQLYTLAEAGLSAAQAARSPKWLRVQAAPGQPRMDEADFRRELAAQVSEAGPLVFEVATADTEENGQKLWTTIGRMTFTEAALSDTCDHRLHFQHPRLRAEAGS